jgi:hypothetical protein
MGYGVTCTAALLYIGIPLPAISRVFIQQRCFQAVLRDSAITNSGILIKIIQEYFDSGRHRSGFGRIVIILFRGKYSGIIKPILATYTFILGRESFSMRSGKIENGKKREE